jgi:hypothetical protein
MREEKSLSESRKAFEFESAVSPTGEDESVVDGVTYRWQPTGRTIRQYFSHFTEGIGPGPGWDTNQYVLEAFGVDDPEELPDTPYYSWLPIQEQDGE